MSSIRQAFRPDNILTYPTDEGSAGMGIIAERTDQQLIEMTLAGDESGFEEIVERHKRLVGRTASRYFQQRQQIEEVVQTVFAKAYFELGAFRGEHSLSLASWLSRITSNSCIDLLRAKQRKPESLDCELSESESDLLSSFADRRPDSEQTAADRDLAQKLLDNVAPEERALLTMLYAEEMSVGEIAGVMGWSVSKVKIRAWRARNKLRRVLKKYL